MTERSVVTIERHIIEQERQFPEATGAFSNILSDFALAAKMISREVRRAGLVDILGQAGSINVHGEQVKKLDEYAHDVIYRALDHCGHLCVMASEESEEVIPIPDRFPTGDYVVLYDPRVRRTIEASESASLSRNTPYAGMELPGRVVATFLRGKATVIEGKLQ